MLQCDNNNILGEVDDDIDFSYEDNTEVYYSCAASLNNEMWVFGGSAKKRQVNFNWTDNNADIDHCWMIRFGIKFILDEQSTRLQIDSC